MTNLKSLGLILAGLCVAGQFAVAEEMLKKADVAAHLRVRAATEGNAAINMQDFIYQYGDRAEYSAEKVKVYEPSPTVPRWLNG